MVRSTRFGRSQIAQALSPDPLEPGGQHEACGREVRLHQRLYYHGEDWLQSESCCRFFELRFLRARSLSAGCGSKPVIYGFCLFVDVGLQGVRFQRQYGCFNSGPLQEVQYSIVQYSMV